MHQRRTRWPDEIQLVFFAFDLQQDGVDLRSLSLSERKRDLTRLCRQSRTPFLKQVETLLVRSCLTTATSLLKASYPSAMHPAIRTDRAGTGSRPNAPIGRATMRSEASCLKVRDDDDMRWPYDEDRWQTAESGSLDRPPRGRCHSFSLPT